MRSCRSSPATIATALIFIAGFVFSLTVNLPGHLSYDSVMQLLEGRTASYNNWHPPVMAWLLGLGDWLVPGAALFVCFDTALAFGSMLALLWLSPRVSWAAAGVAAIAVLTPQMLLYQGIVWKDLLFADSGVAGFACLALAAGFWLRPQLRFGLIACSFALLVLAALARQNGVLLLLAGVIALGWIASLHAPERRWRVAAVYGGATLAASILALMAIGAALDLRVDRNTGTAAQLTRLEGYDIIGAVALQPGLQLGEIERDYPLLDQTIRSEGVRFYNPQRSDTLLVSPLLQSALLNAPHGLIARQWRDLVANHPGLYLRLRADVFRWVFLTPDLMACVPYYAGISGPPDEMKELGLVERDDARDQALQSYGAFFVGTPFFSHAAYAGLAAIALVLLLRRRRPADIAMAAMLGAVLACTLSFFMISIACDYRYLYVLDLSALLAVFYLSLDGFGFKK